jgi:hypothetical protein
VFLGNDDKGDLGLETKACTCVCEVGGCEEAKRNFIRRDGLWMNLSSVSIIVLNSPSETPSWEIIPSYWHVISDKNPGSLTAIE